MGALVLSAAVLLAYIAVIAQAGSPATVDVAVQTALGHLAKCDPGNKDTPCNVFFCKALDSAYRSSLNADFKMADGSCLVANQIHDALFELAGGVRKSKAGALGAWTLIGRATDAAVLERAQACANAGFLTVASSPGAKHGHIVIVVPGQLQQSGWGVSVPLVAGEILNSVGTKAEAGNGTKNPMSRHWTNNDRGTVHIFVQGVHQQAPPKSNQCN